MVHAVHEAQIPKGTIVAVVNLPSLLRGRNDSFIRAAKLCHFMGGSNSRRCRYILSRAREDDGL